MYAWFVILAFIGLLAFSPLEIQQSQKMLDPGRVAGGSWKSEEFARYRTKALRFVQNNPTVNNRLLTDSEVGMTPHGDVAARIQGNILYVYSTLSGEEQARAKELLHNSLAIGQNNSGIFDNGVGAYSLPGFVPNADTVSVVKVR